MLLERLNQGSETEAKCLVFAGEVLDDALTCFDYAPRKRVGKFHNDWPVVPTGFVDLNPNNYSMGGQEDTGPDNLDLFLLVLVLRICINNRHS